MVYQVDLTVARRDRAKGPKWNDLPGKCEIIGVDPGGTTGWAYMSVDPDSLVDPEVKILDNITMHQHGQVPCGPSRDSENAGVNDILRLFKNYPGAFVVIEDFIPQQFNKSRDFLSPVRIGKVLEWWLWTQGRNYIYQMPSEAKTTASDDRLKAWRGRSAPGGLYANDGMEHARDADRHAITWLRKCVGSKSAIAGRRKWAWPHLYEDGRPWGAPTSQEISA